MLVEHHQHRWRRLCQRDQARKGTWAWHATLLEVCRWSLADLGISLLEVRCGMGRELAGCTRPVAWTLGSPNRENQRWGNVCSGVSVFSKAMSAAVTTLLKSAISK